MPSMPATTNEAKTLSAMAVGTLGPMPGVRTAPRANQETRARPIIHHAPAAMARASSFSSSERRNS